GVTGSGTSGCAPWYQTIVAMPAMSRMMLATVHIAALPGSVLPTMGSCGQLLVYETPLWLGRSVEAAQDDQKKNPASALRSAGLGSAFAVIAYFSRRLS